MAIDLRDYARVPDAGRSAGRRGVSAEAQRGRLLVAAVQTVAEHGYRGATVKIVAARAHVSLSTFYEQFPTREACLLAAFDAASESVYATVAAAIDLHDHWPERLRAALETYLEALVRAPVIGQSRYMTLAAAGPSALTHRRAAIDRWAGLVRSEVRRARAEDPAFAAASKELTPDHAVALVGAMDALLLSVDGTDTARSEELIVEAWSVWKAFVLLNPTDARGRL